MAQVDTLKEVKRKGGRPKLGEDWVTIKLKIPREWRELFYQIKEKEHYGSINEVIRSLIRRSLERDYKELLK